MKIVSATNVELEKIFRKIYELGEKNGAEAVLIKNGNLGEWMRKTEVVKKINLSTYNRAVELGLLKPRKLDPNKKNSPIVVKRSEVNYLLQIELEF